MPIVDFFIIFVLEIILSTDNIIFISIVSNNVDEKYRRSVRNSGLALAFFIRLFLIYYIIIIINLKYSISFFDIDIYATNIIFFFGGSFLMYKSFYELKDINKIENIKNNTKQNISNVAYAILNIISIDLVFSVDSIITAISLTKHLYVIVTSTLFSIIIVIIFSEMISKLIEKFKSFKILGLSFIMFVGLVLVLEAFNIFISKTIIYSCFFFSLFVETLDVFFIHSRLEKDKKTNVAN